MIQVCEPLRDFGVSEVRGLESGHADEHSAVLRSARSSAISLSVDSTISGPVSSRPSTATLQDHAEANAPGCEHTWRNHDVLVWDDASVQHKAGGNFKVGEPRRFWRHLIAGGRPA